MFNVGLPFKFLSAGVQKSKEYFTVLWFEVVEAGEMAGDSFVV